MVRCSCTISGTYTVCWICWHAGAAHDAQARPPAYTTRKARLLGARRTLLRHGGCCGHPQGHRNTEGELVIRHGLLLFLGDSFHERRSTDAELTGSSVCDRRRFTTPPRNLPPRLAKQARTLDAPFRSVQCFARPKTKSRRREEFFGDEARQTDIYSLSWAGHRPWLDVASGGFSADRSRPACSPRPAIRADIWHAAGLKARGVALGRLSGACDETRRGETRRSAWRRKPPDSGVSARLRPCSPPRIAKRVGTDRSASTVPARETSRSTPPHFPILCMAARHRSTHSSGGPA